MSSEIRDEVTKLQGLENALRVGEINGGKALTDARQALQSEVESLNKQGIVFVQNVYNELKPADEKSSCLPAITIDNNRLSVLPDDRIKKDWVNAVDRQMLHVPINAPESEYERKRAAFDVQEHKLQEYLVNADRRSYFGLPICASESLVKELEDEAHTMEKLQS
jgi:hypothetical protein